MINTFFDNSLEFLKGVGPIKSKLLFQELGLKTYRDLIYFFLSDILTEVNIFQ